MICEDCNYYTEEYNTDIKDNIPYCVKYKKGIEENNCCKNFNSDLNCYDCDQRYVKYYEIDDIDHYCKKLNDLIYQQTRSVLYKGDFDPIKCK